MRFFNQGARARVHDCEYGLVSDLVYRVRDVGKCDQIVFRQISLSEAATAINIVISTIQSDRDSF